MLKVSRVFEGSLAYKCGIKEGDIILSINGNKLNDLLDYMYYSKDDTLLIEYMRDGKIQKIGLINRKLKPLGIEFEYDNVKRCTNKCIFCFIDQLPKGMRDTLYIKDDDTVLSVLSGNYITLTNLTQKDFERIVKFHLSPLKISVHTTDPQLRQFILKNPKASLILEQLEYLSSNNIEFDAQIVLMKSINDKDNLDRTISDLANFYPNLRSIAVVPVGLTKYRDGLFELEPFSKEDAKEVILQISKWQKEFKRRFGTKLVFASDEFYVKAEEKIPDYRFYEDFRQIENGVGLLALFRKQFLSSLKKLKPNVKIKKRITLVTSVAAYKFMKELIETFNQKYPNIKVDVVAVVNHFFGENVTVAGLLTGQDIISQLKCRELGDYVLVPACALNHENKFLDDVHIIDDVAKEIKKPVYAVQNHGRKLLYYLLKGGEKN
ncbi:protein of unknown function DUF512 [Caldicellulosiruptor acetigenus I77R1B]|uniref:PDZ domain-containing protein n=1 Tax=Caldicellulosiruptor acetigenus (strain ATCC 700853 / DSM 12137 / I77R1B) TaxID=632335 RepID=E4S4U3_CALA7|nr:DUF512 domain-containing protein [Caldicellulosiruptor acetigenus]ADQ41443.1 protein of unknown function DUF512 [Caldicellulosiruptor acetigenus I77R1B]